MELIVKELDESVMVNALRGDTSVDVSISCVKEINSFLLLVSIIFVSLSKLSATHPRNDGQWTLGEKYLIPIAFLCSSEAYIIAYEVFEICRH